MDIFLTNKGKPCFKYNGYLYRLTRESKYAKFYRCTKKDCKANCKTDLADLTILDGRFDHNHPQPEDKQFHRHKVRQGCKRKATEDPVERPSTIILNEVAKNYPVDFLPEDVHALRQAIYRSRRSTQNEEIGIGF